MIFRRIATKQHIIPIIALDKSLIVCAFLSKERIVAILLTRAVMNCANATIISAPHTNCYLFFGKETAGLPEDLLFKNKDRCVRIPMISEARSLNLSNSIAIGVYEVLRQWDFPALSEAGRLRG